MRGFAGFDLGREPVPDETTTCEFRHLLEREQLGATRFAAPSSTKNQDRKRDLEMKQIGKGSQ